MVSICSPRSPRGIRSRPPTANWSTRGWGIPGDAAETRIASYGVADAALAQDLARPVQERPHALDREDLVGEVGEQERLVPRPRADLEDAFGPLQLKSWR